MIAYRTQIFRIRYTETDQMGFAHHSHYLNYFEMARIEWLNSIGFSYAELEQSGVVMPVVSANINFKSPAFFDDPLRIKLTIEKIPRASIKIDYVIVDESEKEIANGSTTLAFLNRETNRPIRCPQRLLEIIESL
ncbi:acyl-CoA thioesterase [Flavobacteriaceae bacterium]|nr:acyl-CoA thioesterase [Flavobacteriaceae bacterium]MDB2314768.1 acyl-CoA thioesterase [Flavobacteriaceae bacterium]